MNRLSRFFDFFPGDETIALKRGLDAGGGHEEVFGQSGEPTPAFILRGLTMAEVADIGVGLEGLQRQEIGHGILGGGALEGGTALALQNSQGMHADMAELGGQQPVEHFAVKARTGEVLLKIVGDEDLLAPGITGAELAPRERGVAQVPALQGDGFENGVGRNFPRDGDFAKDR